MSILKVYYKFFIKILMVEMPKFILSRYRIKLCRNLPSITDCLKNNAQLKKSVVF